MTPKIRHFKIENGKATIDKDGEFLHINDIVLLIVTARKSVENMIAALGDRDDDWVKKSRRSVWTTPKDRSRQCQAATTTPRRAAAVRLAGSWRDNRRDVRCKM